MSSWLRRAFDSPESQTDTHASSRVAVCQRKRTLRIPYHNKADGFMTALVLSLNQVKFCELHACQPRIVWGMYPRCKYAGVRFPGRNPFYDAPHGLNAFGYFFIPVCNGEPAQHGLSMLSCEQREQVHRKLPWSVRTYYYGAGDPQPEPGHNESLAYDAAWYARHRREGARLVSSYLRLQPALLAKVDRLAARLFGQRSAEAPVLGVHLRGTDKGEVLRDETNVAFGKGHKRDNFRKGEEVLLDTLLLSRCDWLLHAASGVAEFAIYWNLQLHKRSVHLHYTRNRQRPPWMNGVPELATRDGVEDGVEG